jgi:hypothetical protein
MLDIMYVKEERMMHSFYMLYEINNLNSSIFETHLHIWVLIFGGQLSQGFNCQLTLCGRVLLLDGGLFKYLIVKEPECLRACLSQGWIVQCQIVQGWIVWG